MEIGVEKYAILIINSWKKETTEGIELPNQKSIMTLGGNKKIKIPCESDTKKQT